MDAKTCLNCGSDVYFRSALCRHCGNPPHVDIASLRRLERREGGMRATTVIGALLTPLVLVAVYVLMVAPR